MNNDVLLNNGPALPWSLAIDVMIMIGSLSLIWYVVSNMKYVRLPSELQSDKVLLAIVLVLLPCASLSTSIVCFLVEFFRGRDPHQSEYMFMAVGFLFVGAMLVHGLLYRRIKPMTLT